MGGNVPLGYDVRDRRLVINESEAQTVRTIFGLYAKLGSVNKVKEEVDRLRLRTKARIFMHGQPGGALPFRTGHLYTILRNPLYVGQVQHKGQTYRGDHSGIVDPVIWDQVQVHLASNAAARRTSASAKEPSLLAGLLFDRGGTRMTPTHAVKSGKRYRYYVSHNLIAGHDIGRSGNRDGTRIPAQEIEQHVADAVLSLLSDGSRLLAAVGVEDRDPRAIRHAVEGARTLVLGLTQGSPSERRGLIQNIAGRVVLEDDLIRIDINRFGLRSVLAIPEARRVRKAGGGAAGRFRPGRASTLGKGNPPHRYLGQPASQAGSGADQGDRSSPCVARTVEEPRGRVDCRYCPFRESAANLRQQSHASRVPRPGYHRSDPRWWSASRTQP